MTWWQLLITTLGPIIAAGLTAWLAHLSQMKKIDKECEIKEKETQKNKQILKAENLKKILSPLKNELFRQQIKQKANKEDFLVYYLDSCGEEVYKNYLSIIKKYSKIPCSDNDNQIFQIILNLMKQGVIQEDENYYDFCLRYGDNTRKSINIEKINEDIRFVNETLNLYIEEI